jgi:hypothetical protein
MTSRVIDRSPRGGMQALLDVLDELENRPPRVSVGVHMDTGAQEHRGPTKGVSVADVAIMQEFGTRTRAPSPFLRPVIDERVGELRELLSAAGQRAIKSVMYGRGAAGHVVRAFGRVAARSQRLIQSRLRGATQDTGHLLESIEGRVNNTVPEVA